MSIGSSATSAKTRSEGAQDAGRLMVLGAGPSQAPGILKAVAAGHDIVTVDPYPGSVGHACSQAWVRCDTRDTAGVLDAATRLRIDGICTFRSDVAIRTVHQVRAQLGLPGASPRAAAVMAHKGAFREFQSGCGLPHPDFVQGESTAGLLRAAARLRPPLWCKPVDSSGSRGVSRLVDVGPEALMRAVEHARGFSSSGRVCVEEEVPGVEVGGDAIVLDGRIAFIAVTQKYLGHGVVTGHRLPTHLPETDRKRVEAAIERAVDVLGYREGPLNFDAMVSARAVTLLEISPRNGGNGLTDLIRHGCGVDVEAATIRLALGEPAAVSPGRRAGVGVRLLGSAEAGRIARLPGLDEWQRHCSEIVDLHCGKREGDAVQPFEHNGNAIGHVVFRCDDAAGYQRTAGEIATYCSTLFEAD
jgi:formate-dependent phosphoribosylglycinamide formyltransferase (GAR transformylase)